MSKINWDKCRRPGVVYTSKRQAALRFEARDRIKATDKQISLLIKLGQQIPSAGLSKQQAMELISHLLSR